MPNLQTGSKGAEVKTLQQQLGQLGVKPRVRVDGRFGEATAQAVAAFQKEYAKLKPTGIVDARTRKALAEIVGKAPKWPHPRFDGSLLRKHTATRKKNEKRVLDAMAWCARNPSAEADEIRASLLSINGVLQTMVINVEVALSSLQRYYERFGKTVGRDNRAAREAVADAESALSGYESDLASWEYGLGALEGQMKTLARLKKAVKAGRIPCAA